jgi:hypothetical protein
MIFHCRNGGVKPLDTDAPPQCFRTCMQWPAYPNIPKKPPFDDNFFSASAISAFAFCSLSPIFAWSFYTVLELVGATVPKFARKICGLPVELSKIDFFFFNSLFDFFFYFLLDTCSPMTVLKGFHWELVGLGVLMIKGYDTKKAVGSNPAQVIYFVFVSG